MKLCFQSFEKNTKLKYLFNNRSIFFIDGNFNKIIQLNDFPITWKDFKKYGNYINIYDFLNDKFAIMCKYNLKSYIFTDLIKNIFSSLNEERKLNDDVTIDNCFSVYLYDKTIFNKFDIDICKILLREFSFLN